VTTAAVVNILQSIVYLVTFCETLNSNVRISICWHATLKSEVFMLLKLQSTERGKCVFITSFSVVIFRNVVLCFNDRSTIR